jgi:hypothetical protein
MHATTSGRDPQRMIEETDMEVKGDDLETMTPTVRIAKSPQDIKTIAIKEMIAEVWDTEATEGKIIRSSL